MKITNLLKRVLGKGTPIIKLTINRLPSNSRFVGKTVLVSGGSSGIGLEIAKEFLEEGAKVIITGRNKTRLNETKEIFDNDNLSVITWDVADVKILEEKFAEMLETAGKIDIFVNNAGVYESSPWNEIREIEFNRVNDINCKGLFFMCQKEGDYFLSKGIKGRIVNICSIAGIKSGFDSYSVSKWGSVCITKGLAKTLASKGIVVNGIAPGNVVTNIHNGYAGKDVTENAYEPAHLTKRFTTVEEIASMVLYLSSDMATNIIGQIIAIDGGWTLN